MSNILLCIPTYGHLHSSAMYGYSVLSRWLTGMDDERESKESMLLACLDDDICSYIPKV